MVKWPNLLKTTNKLDSICTNILSLIFWRYGSQTCLRCVDQAACRALELAKDQSIKKLVLYTDSKFTINGESKHAMATWSAPVSTLVVTGVTRWVKSWKENSWRLKSGGSITNKEDFMKLDQLNAELDVVWVSIRMHPWIWTVHDESLVFQIHIPGHAGYHGNEQADRLSREGALKPEGQQENKWSLFNRCRWTWKRRRALQWSLFLYFLLFQIKFEVWASFSGLPLWGFLNSGGGTCRVTGRAQGFYIWQSHSLKRPPGTEAK